MSDQRSLCNDQRPSAASTHVSPADAHQRLRASRPVPIRPAAHDRWGRRRFGSGARSLLLAHSGRSPRHAASRGLRRPGGNERSYPVAHHVTIQFSSTSPQPSRHTGSRACHTDSCANCVLISTSAPQVLLSISHVIRASLAQGREQPSSRARRPPPRRGPNAQRGPMPWAPYTAHRGMQAPRRSPVSERSTVIRPSSSADPRHRHLLIPVPLRFPPPASS